MGPFTLKHFFTLAGGWLVVLISILVQCILQYLNMDGKSLAMGMGVAYLALVGFFIKLERIETMEEDYPFPYYYLLASACPFGVAYILIRHVTPLMNIRPMLIIALIWLALMVAHMFQSFCYDEKKNPYA